jgi:hypothetical protein
MKLLLKTKSKTMASCQIDFVNRFLNDYLVGKMGIDHGGFVGSDFDGEKWKVGLNASEPFNVTFLELLVKRG